MNTHSPMNWMTKHYVQRPTPFDALEGLIDSGRPKTILLPPSRMFEDHIDGQGTGEDNLSLDENSEAFLKQKSS